MIQTERHLSPLQYKQDIIWPMLALKRLAGNDVQMTEEELQQDLRPRIRRTGQGPHDHVRQTAAGPRGLEHRQEGSRRTSAKIARERSIDPTSKSLDGQIQPIRRFAGNDNLEKEAFKLEEGEISGIIDVSTPEAPRYVILLCEGRTTPIVKSMNEPGHSQRAVSTRYSKTKRRKSPSPRSSSG